MLLVSFFFGGVKVTPALILNWVVEMPPSPAMRYSPGREARGDGHKRRHSLESGILFREKDDDLTLFNEMQSRERDTFLLQSSDDLEDSFGNFLWSFLIEDKVPFFGFFIWGDIHSYISYFYLWVLFYSYKAETFF